MNRRGFTLIENLITLALLSTIGYWTIRQLGLIGESQSNLAHRLRARQLMEMEYSKLKGQSARFPLIVNSGRAITYTRCFDRSFSAVPGTVTLAEATSTTPAVTASSTNYYALNLEDPGVAAPNFCMAAEFEIHITPSLTAPNSAVINSLVILGRPDVLPRVTYRINVRFEPGI